MIHKHPTPRRISPIPLPQGDWREINGMPTLLHLPIADAPLKMADLSCLTRFGIKGSGASAWLASQDIPIPDRPNTWLSLPTGGLIARLGLTEFLIEDSLGATGAAALLNCDLPEAVYPVLRQDAAIALWGTALPDLLLQTCNINFRALDLRERPIVLTSMAGVAVTLLPSQPQNIPYYRIWCDGTFGAYLWQTLKDIVEELSGSIVGIEQIDRFP